MKHLRFILPVVLCCVVAGLMTSCLNDNNDDNGLSKEEQLQAFQTVRGNYSGDVIFYKNTYDGMSTPTKKDIDTLKASFSLLTDSTAHINNLPLAALANQIKDSKVAEAVMNGTVTTTPVNLYTYYYVVSPATCLVGADYVEVKATYDGEEHTIRLPQASSKLACVLARYGLTAPISPAVSCSATRPTASSFSTGKGFNPCGPTPSSLRSEGPFPPKKWRG